jgi:hypothetical protein
MKKKIELEFPMNTSPRVLFPRLSTPGGLVEWFADNVIIKGSTYVFIWDGVEQSAKQSYIRENLIVRYEWVEEDDYFEFKLKTDELTGELALIVTDFVEDDEEKETSDLWEAQVSSLKKCIGL